MHDSVDWRRKMVALPWTIDVRWPNNVRFWRDLEGYELANSRLRLTTWPLLFRSRVERRDFAYDRAMVRS
jgi:hypothetical protein